MASNSFGEIFRMTTFGESHGPAVGVVIDGLPAGIMIDLARVQLDMDRRKPGVSALSSRRKESDQIVVLSGLFEGRTTGAPMAMIVHNADARPADYETIKDMFRPGHADYAWQKKYGIRDWRGGGRSSARETVGRVMAGAVARQILERESVQIFGHVVSVGGVTAEKFDAGEIDRNDVRCADPDAARRMAEIIIEAKSRGDSVGGVVEIVAQGVPAGWGDPVFCKLEAQLGSALLSIGSVKGVEFGDGFKLAEKRGSESNDEILPAGFATNRMGGILGGISNGMPVVARIAVKPTPSISVTQSTVDCGNNPVAISVPGRHDPCICPRIVPVAEAMTAVVLCDAFLRQKALGLF